MSKFKINKEVEDNVLNLVSQLLKKEAHKILDYYDEDCFVQLTPELIEHIIKMCLNWEKEEDLSSSIFFYEEWNEEEQEEFRGKVGTWVYIDWYGMPWKDIMKHDFLPSGVNGYMADDYFNLEWDILSEWLNRTTTEFFGIQRLYIAFELYRRNGIDGKELKKKVKKRTGCDL